MSYEGHQSETGFGACLNAGMEITWLGARLPYEYFSSSSNDIIAIINNNDGTEKVSRGQ